MEFIQSFPDHNIHFVLVEKKKIKAIEDIYSEK